MRAAPLALERCSRALHRNAALQLGVSSEYCTRALQESIEQKKCSIRALQQSAASECYVPGEDGESSPTVVYAEHWNGPPAIRTARHRDGLAERVREVSRQHEGLAYEVSGN